MWFNGKQYGEEYVSVKWAQLLEDIYWFEVSLRAPSSPVRLVTHLNRLVFSILVHLEPFVTSFLRPFVTCPPNTVVDCSPRPFVDSIL